jgi:N-acetylmuramoyl-L-alanine amidase
VTACRFARATRWLAAVGLVLAVSFAVRLLGQGQASLTLLARDTRRSIPVTVVNEQELVSLDELASIFQLTVREEATAVTVSSRGRTIVFNPDQTIASVAGRMISLPARPARIAGRLWVPLDFISRAVAPVADTRVELRRASRLLIVGDVRVPRVTMVFEPQAVGHRLLVDASPATNSTLTRDADHLTIKFDADAIDAVIPGVQPQPFLQAIRRVDPVTLAIDLGPRFGSYRSSTQVVDNVSHVSLELLPLPAETAPVSTGATPGTPGATPATAAATPPPSTATLSPPADLPTFGQPTSPIRTVTIDPGHGGPDQGVVGAGGLTEKALTLAVGRRVKTTLETRLGLRVLLTREDDRELPLDARTAVANNNKADLFISLHANASLRPTNAGASMLVAQFPDEGVARRALEPHRVPVFGGGNRDIELVPWGLAQIRYLDQSTVLADLLQQHIGSRAPLDLRPTDRAPLRVLASANMPAVLIELGYLSNAEQEARLGNGEYQTGIANAIVDAVVEFRDHLSRAPEADR